MENSHAIILIFYYNCFYCLFLLFLFFVDLLLITQTAETPLGATPHSKGDPAARGRKSSSSVAIEGELVRVRYKASNYVSPRERKYVMKQNVYLYI